jgi:hypothetical protein
MSDLERVAIAMRHRYAEMTNDLPLVPFEKSQARTAWLECARVAIETMDADDTLWQRENHDLVEEKAALRAANDRLREALTIISEHRRAPGWIKRVVDAALAKEGK